MSLQLWTEKYRPQKLDDYVWRDAEQRRKIEEWIAEGALPHLMFSGAPGVGKTSLAKLLLRELNIPPADIMEINASRERRVEEIQSRFQNFVGNWAFNASGIKYIIFDEADSMSPLAQRMLRGDMETYSDTTRIIFTCNYPTKIISPIHDRCQKMQFAALDRDEFMVRIGVILFKEGVSFEAETISDYTDRAYPSMRKCINLMQENTINGVLIPPKAEEEGGGVGKDYIIEMVSLFKTKRFLEARKMIVTQAQPEEYPDIYRYFYRNLDMFSNDPQKQDDALLIIRDAVVRHNMVADQEINLSACLVELSRI